MYGVILEWFADNMFVCFVWEPGASSSLDLKPTSDFDPQGISEMYNLKTLCIYEIMDKLFYQKNCLFTDFITISNHYVTL